jgi:hypothetical protein
MSCGRGLVIREFAFDPDIDKSPLEHIPNLKTELGDGIDLPLEFGVSHFGSIVYPNMDERLMWLPDAEGTAWAALGNALRTGLPVPAGFVVFRVTAEERIRAAYEELKIRERTHFVAVRGTTHPVLNVIGPDRLIHTLRRLWMESADAPLLVQRMIHSTWCGKAESDQQNIQIGANEGMMILDPDTYVVNSDGNCIAQTLQPKQRKMIRHVDGTGRVVQREGERTPIPAGQLKQIAALATRTATHIGWAIDDTERLWLISIQ